MAVIGVIGATHIIHGDVSARGTWFCECGGTAKVKCGALLAVFRASKKGYVTRRMRLTTEGLRQALSGLCPCWRHGPLYVYPQSYPDYVPPAPTPPTEVPADVPGAPPRPAKNARCPCGSGRKFKDCLGPRGFTHPLMQPELIQPKEPVVVEEELDEAAEQLEEELARELREADAAEELSRALRDAEEAAARRARRLGPRIASIVPTHGPAAGGTRMVIHGVRFRRDSIVAIAGGAPASATVASRTEIHVVMAPHAPGIVAVEVTVPGLGRALVLRGFAYDRARWHKRLGVDGRWRDRSGKFTKPPRAPRR